MVSPGSVYNTNKPGKLTVLLQKAEVYRTTGCAKEPCAGQWRLKNYVKAVPVSPVSFAGHGTGGGTTLRKSAQLALERLRVPQATTDAWPTDAILGRLALLKMQETLHADVSMIQSRDLFEPKQIGEDLVTPDNLRDLIHRVYWKGDYALPMPVTGATLKSLLKKSDAFTAAENNSVNIDIEKGQGLVDLGIFKELASKTYFVNGQPIQDGSLYSVAATDYLAFGDTGYTDFQTPPVPPQFRLKDFKTLHPIANLVCDALQDALVHAGSGNFTNAHCGATALIASDQEDESSQLPFDTTSGYTAWRQFRAFAAPAIHFQREFPVYAGTNEAERVSQGKPRFSLTVEKTDLSFTFVQPQNASVQTSQFAGNPISQVTAPASLALSYDNRTRFRWAGRRFDWFAMDDLSYSATKTQNTPTSLNYVRSLSTNALGAEVGFLARIWPRRKEPWDVKFLFSERLDTQLHSPLLSLPLNDAQMSTYLQNVNHTYRRLTKNGLRWDDRKNWLETGVEYGENYRLQSEYIFGSQPCGVGAGTLGAAVLAPGFQISGDPRLLDCVAYYSSVAQFPSPAVAPITESSPLTIQTTDRPERGIFLNFSFTVPLPVSAKISWLVENKGDLFANMANDNPTDERYFDQLSNSLVIAAIGNLSVKPEFDLFAFKARSTGYTIVTRQLTLNLSYAFDWHSGLPWWRTLKYANPAPTTSTPSGGK